MRAHGSNGVATEKILETRIILFHVKKKFVVNITLQTSRKGYQGLGEYHQGYREHQLRVWHHRQKANCGIEWFWVGQTYKE